MSRLAAAGRVFDALKFWWEHPRVERRVTNSLIGLFVLVLALTECSRLQLLPPWFAPFISPNNFQAIHLAFSMVLFMEVVGLILSIPGPMARSMGKQLEILSLILLRTSFEQLGEMHEPIDLNLDYPVLPCIAATSCAAVFIYACLGLFYRFPACREGITPEELDSFILAKKLISLAVCAALLVVAAHDLQNLIFYARKSLFFENIYTIMIFADICLVLVSQRYLPHYQDVFRNSGYVMGTLFMRIALGAPPLFEAGLSVFAALYILALTWITRRLGRPVTEKNS